MSSYFQEAGSDTNSGPYGLIALIERSQITHCPKIYIPSNYDGHRWELTIVVIEGNRAFLRCVKGSECFHSDPGIDNDSKSKRHHPPEQTQVQLDHFLLFCTQSSPVLRSMEAGTSFDIPASPDKTTQIPMFVGDCYKYARIQHTRIVILYTKRLPCDNRAYTPATDPQPCIMTDTRSAA